MSRRKYRRHTLLFLFDARRFTECEGMNWLQDRGLIADEHINLDTVGSDDTRRVLDAAAASGKFNPAWVTFIRDAFERNLQIP